MNRAVRVGLCACLAAALSAGAAETQPPPKPAAASVRVEFTDTTLKNGLRVQLVQDHGAPVIALNIAYDVGSRNERRGRTGFAHLFEHMMFKGSASVGNGEHFYQVFSNGGSMNGTTGNDLTLYFETLPANQLELALFLEADRMRSLAITQDNLDNQRQAVQEERRLRVDNQPYGLADEHFDELFYSNFAYQHSTIGSMDDLNAASVGDVAQFFKTYYAPNNAVSGRRLQARRGAGADPSLLRRHSAAGRAAGGRPERAAAASRAARSHDGCAGARDAGADRVQDAGR